MAQIEYVGQKARKEDNVGGTHIVWDGPGDVQEVPDDKVHLYLAHAGIWRAVPGQDIKPRVKSMPVKDDQEMDENDLLALQVNVPNMTKDALITFAKRVFNRELNPKAPVPTLRNQVTKLIVSRGSGTTR